MEKDKYEELLRKMKNIVTNLNLVLNLIEDLNNNLINSIEIGNVIYKKNNVDSLSNKITSDRDKITNIIIPRLQSKLNESNN